ncbi:NADPH dependent diflavin oxidoreductase-like protein 1 [Paraphoma chrysanthemicola]|uniref:NADPH-dependent diflavin oxidoreductase 1 n=1 Tax=Paraphoma chrysanthemicola TaxID=798071 RepID=A0A8K0QSF7_9PLEO|nr:NADPH dependent diflavin oxidoreductase-like protein 1 [Paraphoma chrysanthemicola]
MASTQHARRALVVYGSETGNAQDVAEEMGRLAVRLRFDTEVAELNAISLKQLLQHDVVLIAIATSGQGDLPPNSQTFWRALRSARLRPGCLQQVKFASFGLGDTSYPKFNWAHRKLYNRLIQLGAQPICDRGECDDQQPEGVDGSFIPWSFTLRQRLLEQYPIPEGVEPIPDDVLLDPNWILDFADTTSPSSNGTSSSITPSDIDAPPPTLLPIPNSIPATLNSNTRVTPPTHWQDVRHLKFSLPGIHPYAPGDTLTIYPRNFSSDVSAFLSLMNWTSIADRPLHFVPSSPSVPSTSPLPIRHLCPSSSITLRQILTDHLDIMSIPRRSFFAHLAHYTSDPFQKDRLIEFTNPEYIDELYDYTTRPRRSILEVLQEFETVTVPWQNVCALVPVMRGRLFSIASACNTPTSLPSSPTTTPPGTNGAEEVASKTTDVELLVAIVKYKTVIKRIRQGVCTRYISALEPGQKLSVTLQKGGLGVTQKEMDRPVVMIGPGTGVAPMRSLIYQRMQWRQERGSSEEDKVKDVLFFGCRNADADYFFKHEWTHLVQSGVPLDVFAAFSRDQRQKVYVQDLVRQQSALIHNALAKRNGIVYICGSSGKMPQAIREALIETFVKEGAMEREAAEGYLAAMEKGGRYKQETW